MSDSKRLTIYGDVVKYQTPVPEFNGMWPTRIKTDVLKKQGYPLHLCNLFVSCFTKLQDYQIVKSTDAETLLIPMPSTSKKNILPRLFAGEIQKLTNCAIKHSSGIRISREVRLEAKNAHSLHERNLRFAPFQLNAELLQIQCRGYKNIVLVDDFITTGETVINLAKQMRTNGINVTGAIAMIPFTNRYPSADELIDFENKIFVKAGLNERQQVVVKKAIKNVFGDYLILRMKHEINENTFDTKERAQLFCSNILLANKNIRTLESKIDIDQNLSL